MATLTNQEIEQLKQQLKEKQEEVKAIYDQLAEAGVVALPDDFLDSVAGGLGGIPKPSRVPSYTTVAQQGPYIPSGNPRP